MQAHKSHQLSQLNKQGHHAKHAAPQHLAASKHSKGGKSIVALNATARGGSLSRIVPKVEMVTALRTDVDIVVTEYGVAELKHASNQERAEALINIAAPDFRDALKACL